MPADVLDNLGAERLHLPVKICRCRPAADLEISESNAANWSLND